MNDLVIRYSVSKLMKAAIIFSGGYLIFISLSMSIFQAVGQRYSFFFFAGVAGILLGLALILSFTLWESKPIVVISNRFFQVRLPKQKINGKIDWDDVSQVGIGLSFLTLKIIGGAYYKLDFEGLKYADLRDVKTRVIEACETKGIYYSNL